MTNHDGGKGDAPRPIQNKEQFDKNWDEIFKEKDDETDDILATIPFGR